MKHKTPVSMILTVCAGVWWWKTLPLAGALFGYCAKSWKTTVAQSLHILPTFMIHFYNHWKQILKRTNISCILEMFEVYSMWDSYFNRLFCAWKVGVCGWVFFCMCFVVFCGCFFVVFFVFFGGAGGSVWVDLKHQIFLYFEMQIYTGFFYRSHNISKLLFSGRGGRICLIIWRIIQDYTGLYRIIQPCSQGLSRLSDWGATDITSLCHSNVWNIFLCVFMWGVGGGEFKGNCELHTIGGGGSV